MCIRDRLVGEIRSIEEELESVSSEYFTYQKDYYDSLKNYKCVITREELKDEIKDRNIIYLGDFHLSPECQDNHLDIISYLKDISKETGKPPAIAVEFINSSYQKSVDRYLDGKIDENRLRLGTNYDRNFGFNYESYVRILRYARDNNIPLYAADRPGGGSLNERDEYAADRIADIYRKHGEEHQLVVIYGTYHVVPNHLPKMVKQRLPDVDQVSVVCEAPDIYWKTKIDGNKAVQVNDDIYFLPDTDEITRAERYLDYLYEITS